MLLMSKFAMSNDKGWYKDNYNLTTNGNTTTNLNHKAGIDLIFCKTECCENEVKKIKKKVDLKVKIFLAKRL